METLYRISITSILHEYIRNNLAPMKIFLLFKILKNAEVPPGPSISSARLHANKTAAQAAGSWVMRSVDAGAPALKKWVGSDILFCCNGYGGKRMVDFHHPLATHLMSACIN